MNRTAAYCFYCQSAIECSGPKSTNGRDLERFERLHSRQQREKLAAAREAIRKENQNAEL